MSYATPSPQPLVKLEPAASDAVSLEARERWRASLTDADVRALAYEWKTGHNDQCSEDAWAEYEYRFGERANGPRQEFTQKPRRRAPKESRRRKAKGD